MPMKEKVFLAALIVLFIVALGSIGACDQTNEILSAMKPQVIQVIKDKGYNTNREIANEYMSNKASYDQLAKQNLW